MMVLIVIVHHLVQARVAQAQARVAQVIVVQVVHHLVQEVQVADPVQVHLGQAVRQVRAVAVVHHLIQVQVFLQVHHLAVGFQNL